MYFSVSAEPIRKLHAQTMRLGKFLERKIRLPKRPRDVSRSSQGSVVKSGYLIIVGHLVSAIWQATSRFGSLGIDSLKGTSSRTPYGVQPVPWLILGTKHSSMGRELCLPSRFCLNSWRHVLQSITVHPGPVAHGIWRNSYLSRTSAYLLKFSRQER